MGKRGGGLKQHRNTSGCWGSGVKKRAKEQPKMYQEKEAEFSLVLKRY